MLSLAPYTLNGQGVNVCPKASKGCILGCINTSGHGQFNSVQLARINKTNYLLSNRLAFLTQLWNELEKINRKAEKTWKKIPVRLNGYSDLDFPKLFTLIKKDLFSLNNIIFYDYTKVDSRLEKYKDKPYYLTFSRSETNEQKAVELLKKGFNVSVVFRDKLPDTWNGFPVFNGDDSDLRFLDPFNHVIGLKAKGKGKKDRTGFIVN
jgi:hypothetical protein